MITWSEETGFDTGFLWENEKRFTNPLCNQGSGLLTAEVRQHDVTMSSDLVIKIGHQISKYIFRGCMNFTFSLKLPRPR